MALPITTASPQGFSSPFRGGNISPTGAYRPNVPFSPPSPRPDPVSSWVGRSTRGSAPSIGGTLSRGLSTGLLIVGAANLIVDAIGRAGAYQWRDNLLNQTNGGNSNKVEGEPPSFTGGQDPRWLYRVQGVVSGELIYNGITWPATVAFSRNLTGPIRGFSFRWKIVDTMVYGVATLKSGSPDVEVIAIATLLGFEDLWTHSETITAVTPLLGPEPEMVGNPSGVVSGQDNTTPFLAPPVAAYASPNAYPSAIPVNIGSAPVPAPEIAAIPLPIAPQSLAPVAPAIPLVSPTQTPNLAPTQNPNLAPTQAPNLAPTQTPNLAPPTTDLSKLIEGQRAQRERDLTQQKQADSLKQAQNIQTSQANASTKSAICEESQPGKCIDNAVKRNSPQSQQSSITVKEFDKCGDDGKPVFKTKSINVPKGSEAYITNLFEEIADTAGLSCSINVTATLPDSWMSKIPDERPQAAVYYREWNNGKWGDYTCSVHIPYYSKPKGFKPSLPIIKKGGHFGILKLKDNSQIYVNCESPQEAKRVIAELRKFTGVEGKGARPRFGEYGDGDIKKVTVKAVRLDYYPKGKAGGVGWSVQL